MVIRFYRKRDVQIKIGESGLILGCFIILSVFDKSTGCVVSTIDSVGQKSIKKELDPRTEAKAFRIDADELFIVICTWQRGNGRKGG